MCTNCYDLFKANQYFVIIFKSNGAYESVKVSNIRLPYLNVCHK